MAGLSPAWQHILVMDEFHLGEVNRAKQSIWCSSGKVTNVALAVRALGGPLRALTVLGGSNGEQIRRELEEMSIPLRCIPCTAETRVCTTIIDEQTGTITELVENARPLSPAECDSFLSAFVGEVALADEVVLTGSIPPGVSSEMFARCLKSANSAVRFILDIRGDELLSSLPYEPFLVKPNCDELSRTVGRELRTETEVFVAMRELNAHGAQWVLITQGSGNVLLSSAKEQLRFQSLSVPVVNPIGCGDCLAAGLAFGLDRGMTLPDAVKLGIAAAAENTRELLPSRLNLGRVQELARTVRILE
ncbi:MAG: 1-phosphofructokinase family hexose kinase [Planctomycetaceae bacterium]